VLEKDRISQIDEPRRFQLLVDSVVDYAIYLIDLDGRVRSWNAGAARMKGYSADEIAGEQFARFYTPEDRAAGIPDKALRIAREKGRFQAEGWRVRKDGSRFWAVVVIDAVRTDAGELIGFAKITRDITDKQEASHSLFASEARYRQLIDAVVDYAIFQLDSEGNVTTWNPGAERIKGYAPNEIIGRHFSQFYTEEDRAAGVPAKALAAAASVGRYEAEGWRMRKDGSRFRASVVIDRIQDELGSLVGFAKITRDISERYEAEKKLKEAQEHLAGAQKMEAIGQLSGGIAHDFNNLLMIVIGNLETAQRYAKEHLATPNLIRALSHAMRGAQRASVLTSRLLAFSRRQPLDPKAIDVNKFLGSAAEFLQRSIGETIEIEAVGGAGLWTVEADPNHLESALVNLAINARDAMPNGGRLTLEGANVFADEEYHRSNPEISTGQYVVICVTDTGTGMSSDVVGRAFEPFFTTKELGQGTGLGLSQVYGFVKQSGGHVKIYSEVGHGTTVKLYLPRFIGQGLEGDDADPEPLAEGEFDETILVVEDDNDLRAYLVNVLRDLHYRVVSASSAEAAISLLQSGRPIDLVLTDIVMPGATGRDLGRMIKELHPKLPVLYMTGYSRNAVVHQGRLEKGVELLQKPISQTVLAARVRALIDIGKRS
jgi:PAS domain S-box-containing protein